MPDPQLSVFSLARGSEGVKTTLLYMRDLVKQSDQHRIVKETAVSIIRNINPKDQMGQVKAITRWVKDKMHYVRDIYGVEEVTSPWVMIENLLAGTLKHSSDCDDFATLLSALLRAVGFPTRLEAVAVNSKDRYDHARVSARIGKWWVPIEGTRKEMEVGKRLRTYLPVMAVEVI